MVAGQGGSEEVRKVLGFWLLFSILFFSFFPFFPSLSLSPSLMEFADGLDSCVREGDE